jgi:hypothetical protein
MTVLYLTLLAERCLCYPAFSGSWDHVESCSLTDSVAPSVLLCSARISDFSSLHESAHRTLQDVATALTETAVNIRSTRFEARQFEASQQNTIPTALTCPVPCG